MKTVFVLVGDYWHSAASIHPLMEQIFDQGWKVTYTERPEDIYDLAEIPDIILSFKDPIENDQIPTDIWCDSRWTDHLEELVAKKGTGLILAHAAVTDLDREHRIVKDMIHSMFITHPEQCPMQMIKTAEHPVMDGVENFEFPEKDEQYQMEMTDIEAVQILAYTQTDHGRQPAVWISELENGKICCLTPAHTTKNLTCEGFVTIMKNAINRCSR